MLLGESPQSPKTSLVAGKRAVDYFAGAGGWTIACERLGVRVVFAVNHWDLAIRAHQINFPQTRAVQMDAWTVDATRLPRHDIFIASPSCTGFSEARGSDRPQHDAARMTIWAVVEVLDLARPDVFVVENVLEIKKSASYRVWLNTIRGLGYRDAIYELDSVEFGVAQERPRFFLVGTRGKRPIQIMSPQLAPVPASSIIDVSTWRDWGPVIKKGRAERTVEAVRRFRGVHGEIFAYVYHGNPNARRLDRPLGTIPAADTWAVVRWPNMRMLTIGEAKAAMGFPADYKLCGSRDDQIEQIGNAVVVPVAGEVVAQALGASPGWACRQLGFAGGEG